jgi:protoporphyrinogen oxidase
VAARFRGKRLTIIGGGVMGLMTAYQAAPLADSARFGVAEGVAS